MVFTTYSNVEVPNFMYGTAWKKEATTDLVRLAVQSGFTAIDTANQLIHYDEKRVGDALQLLKDNGVGRDKLFLQTKFTPVNGQGDTTPYDAGADLTTQVRQSMASSLEHLRTEQVDSYVLHGPYSRYGLTHSDLEVWSAMEALLQEGKTRIIGVSNVSAEQLQLFCEKSQTKPMVVQNRCFAASAWDKDVREICRREGIIYQGFSLLTANPQSLGNPYVRDLAEKLSVTVPQLIFAFSVQIGILPLTGTSNKEHMMEDLEADKVKLSEDEVNRIESLVAYKSVASRD